MLQYYVENSHESTIPFDLNMHVQKEMVRRAYLHSGVKEKNGFTAVGTFYLTVLAA